MSHPPTSAASIQRVLAGRIRPRDPRRCTRQFGGAVGPSRPGRAGRQTTPPNPSRHPKPVARSPRAHRAQVGDRADGQVSPAGPRLRGYEPVARLGQRREEHVVELHPAPRAYASSGGARPGGRVRAAARGPGSSSGPIVQDLPAPPVLAVPAEHGEHRRAHGATRRRERSAVTAPRLARPCRPAVRPIHSRSSSRTEKLSATQCRYTTPSHVEPPASCTNGRNGGSPSAERAVQLAREVARQVVEHVSVHAQLERRRRTAANPNRSSARAPGCVTFDRRRTSPRPGTPARRCTGGRRPTCGRVAGRR